MSYSYPNDIDQVPYASFLHIKKYSYSKAMKEVSKGQDDALGLMSGPGSFIRNAADLTAAMGGGSSITGRTDISYVGIGGTTRLGQKEQGAGLSALERRRIQRNTQKRTGWWTGALPGGMGTGFSMPWVDNASQEERARRVAIGTAEEQRRRAFNANKAGLFGDYCNLALPMEMQYQYDASWNNTFKLGVLALAADNAGEFMTAGVLGAAGIAISSKAALAGAATTAGGTAITGSGMAKAGATGYAGQKAFDGLGDQLGGAAKAVTDPFGVGTQINPRNIAGLAGLAPNENAIQMFKNMDFRKFDFSFQFAARDADEAAQIEEMIEWFKMGMHPGKFDGQGSAIMLDFPDVFELYPKFVPVESGATQPPVRHPMMPKTKLCGLTNLTVNLTPMGQLQTIFDGSFPIVTVNLKFTELTALTKADFGNMSGGTTGGGGKTPWTHSYGSARRNKKGRITDAENAARGESFQGLKRDDFYSY